MSDEPLVTEVRSGPVSRREAVIATAGTAAAAGFLVGYLAAPPDVDADADLALGMLLRFMALLKLATAFGAAALVLWRLRFPIGPKMSAAYIAAVSLMAAAPGLIWQSAFVVAGAILFHAGLSAGVVLSLTDGGWRASPTSRPFSNGRPAPHPTQAASEAPRRLRRAP